MKKIFLCLWFSASTSLALQAQTIRVLDEETQQGLQYVAVVGFQPSAIAFTNSKGEADISALAKSSKIEIQLSGYRIVTTTYAELVATPSVALSASPLVLEEMVVTASRWRQPTNRIPQKVVTIPAREIALVSPQTSADLLGISGNVFIQKSQQGGGSPMIRGFATNRLLYAVDGVRMNTAIFRGGNIQNVISLDPLANESVEVLFGPGSVTYGSDAIGGVMSFQTLAPVYSVNQNPYVAGNALVRTSSANNEFTGHMDVRVGWKKWALVTSISQSDFGDLMQGSHGPDDYLRNEYVVRQNGQDVVMTNPDPRVQTPSAYSQFNLMQKVGWKPSSTLDFTYAFHFSETSPYARYDRHLRTRNGLPRYGEWNYGPQLWRMHQLTMNTQVDGMAFDRVALRLALQNFEESRIDRSLNSDFRTTQTEQVDAYSANVDFFKELGGQHTLSYGLEWVQNDVRSTGVVTDIVQQTDSTGPSRYPLSTWSSAGVFVTDQWDVTTRLSLQGGLRYNLVNLTADFSNNLAFYPFPYSSAENQNGGLTGNLGAVFRPNEAWMFQANLSRAFRAPNVDDIGKVFDSEPGAVLVPNPALVPEEAWNADLGVAVIIGGVFKADATAFYTRLNNALVRRPFALNGQDSIVYDGQLSQVLAIQNASLATVWGVQLGMDWALPAGFSLSADMNFQRGEEELEDGSTSPLRHAAPFFGIGRLNYDRGPLNLMFNVQYQAGFTFDQLPAEEQSKTEIYALDENGNPYAPAWYTLNFRARYAISNAVSVSAGVDNLADLRYRPYSSGISAPGRNFVMAVQARF